MDEKKLAAAMAAVFTYIKTSEEAFAMQAAASAQADADLSAAPKPVGYANNIWAVTGRQSMMQANTMMQMRMFK